MTSIHRPEPDPDDEILSAYLDGELDEGDRRALAARLATDAALIGRLEWLAAPSALVATVPSASAEERDHTVAASLAALDDTVTAPSPIALSASAAPARRPSRRPAVLWSLAAALLVAVGVAGVVRLAADSSEEGTSAETANGPAAARDAADADDDAGAAPAEPERSPLSESAMADQPETAAAPAAQVRDLGAADSVSSVLSQATDLAGTRSAESTAPSAAATSSVPTTSPSAPPTTTAATTSPPATRHAGCGGEPLARATVSGRAVVAATEEASGRADIVVRDAMTCVELGRVRR